MNASPSPSRGAYQTDAQRWRALEQRDAAADGQFVYAVVTTGIYCRPGCPSRLARRENVAFHPTCADAERAGFRPCQRCRPGGASLRARHAALVAAACRAIEAADAPLSLEALAATAGLSRHHFHRLFKAAIGVTPRQFAAAHRTGRVRSELRTGASVTDAIHGAGFSSSSRFYERAAETLGMTPRKFQSGGSGVAIRFAIALCPLGLVLVAGTARGLCAVRFGEDRAALEQDLRADFPRASFEKPDRAFDAWVRAIVTHIQRPAAPIDLPLDIQGTAFQQRVWQALREIPAGQTASYAEVAARIGQPSAVRAVASACAANSVALLVPCHRVVRTSGALSGYRWGLERKRQLLEREGAR